MKPVSTASRASTACRVLLLDEWPLVEHGVRQLLAPFDHGLHLLTDRTALHHDTPVDVTLFDTHATRSDRVTTLPQVLSNPAAGAVIVYSWSVTPLLIRSALDAGARGYLSKGLSGEDLAQSIRRVHSGETVVSEPHGSASLSHLADLAGEVGLTIREAEVVAFIAQGLANTDIAQRLYVSINTVKSYVRTAYRKMNVTTRPEAILWAIDNGLRRG